MTPYAAVFRYCKPVVRALKVRELRQCKKAYPAVCQASSEPAHPVRKKKHDQPYRLARSAPLQLIPFQYEGSAPQSKASGHCDRLRPAAAPVQWTTSFEAICPSIETIFSNVVSDSAKHSFLLEHTDKSRLPLGEHVRPRGRPLDGSTAPEIRVWARWGMDHSHGLQLSCCTFAVSDCKDGCEGAAQARRALPVSE